MTRSARAVPVPGVSQPRAPTKEISLPWFRRRKNEQEPAPIEAAAPVAPPESARPTPPPAEGGAATDPSRPKRRRGSRGGRGRKKPGTGETQAQAEQDRKS